MTLLQSLGNCFSNQYMDARHKGQESVTAFICLAPKHIRISSVRSQRGLGFAWIYMRGVSSIAPPNYFFRDRSIHLFHSVHTMDRKRATCLQALKAFVNIQVWPKHRAHN